MTSFWVVATPLTLNPKIGVFSDFLQFSASEKRVDIDQDNVQTGVSRFLIQFWHGNNVSQYIMNDD